MRTNSTNKATTGNIQNNLLLLALFDRRSGDHSLSRRALSYMGRISSCACPAVQLAEIRPKTAANIDCLSGRVEACFPPARRGSVRSPMVQEFGLKYSRYKDGTM
jgi:hypothetical protein